MAILYVTLKDEIETPKVSPPDEPALIAKPI
jgi:hypothetical protein